MKHRRVKIVLGMLVFFSLFPITSYACSCAFSESAQEEFNRVDFVYTGKVLKIESIKGFQELTTFQVLKKFKGTFKGNVELLTEVAGPSCGITFQKGTTYLVYGYLQQGTLGTNRCTRTKEISQAKEDLIYLDTLKGYTPLASLTQCEKAGGTISQIEECDGSMSDWCTISEKQQCYADQVKNGRCRIGQYSEELKGMVGITPRVLCQEGLQPDG